ncbi:hypothetical protein HK102_013319, partial [Quaeritorhiza haematococci]
MVEADSYFRDKEKAVPPFQLVHLSDGRKLAYAAWGAPKSEAEWVLLYLHGFPSCRLEAQPASEVCKELKIHLIAVDRPGYARSDADPKHTFSKFAQEDVPQLLQAALKFDEPAQDDDKTVAEGSDLDSENSPPTDPHVLRRLRKRVLIVGGSGGGPYALACARFLTPSQPYLNHGITSEDDTLRVRAVGVMGSLSPGFPQSRLIKFLSTILPERVMASLVGFLFPVAPVSEAHIQRYIATLDDSDRAAFDERPDVVIALRGALDESCGEDVNAMHLESARMLRRYNSPWPFSIEDIKPDTPDFPALAIFHGEQDTSVPIAHGKYIASKIPGATVKWFEGGHYAVPVLRMRECLEMLTSLAEGKEREM